MGKDMAICGELSHMSSAKTCEARSRMGCVQVAEGGGIPIFLAFIGGQETGCVSELGAAILALVLTPY